MERLVPGWMAAVLLVNPVRSRENDDSPSAYMKAAVATATWIRANEVITDAGETWPIARQRSKVTGTGRYHGSPGVALFFLELHAATSDAGYLRDATGGADHLISQIPSAAKTVDWGLYSGLATAADAARPTCPRR